MPLGSLVATCRIADCVRTDMIDSAVRVTPYDISPKERAFGDYSPGRYAWVLADVEALNVPVPIRGCLGLFTLGELNYRGDVRPCLGMRCLTLWQPWASLIAVGAKRFETRSWGTDWRGSLAIHASLKWSREQADLCATRPFAAALRAHGIELPAAGGMRS